MDGSKSEHEPYFILEELLERKGHTYISVDTVY